MGSLPRRPSHPHACHVPPPTPAARIDTLATQPVPNQAAALAASGQLGCPLSCQFHGVSRVLQAALPAPHRKHSSRIVTTRLCSFQSKHAYHDLSAEPSSLEYIMLLYVFHDVPGSLPSSVFSAEDGALGRGLAGG